MMTGQRSQSLRGRDIEAGRGSGHVSDTERSASPTEATIENDVYGRTINRDIDSIVDEWASSLSKLLEVVPLYMCRPGHPGRISRIPENLRDVDNKAYEPYFMSIGPYHHGIPRVQETEERKVFALKCFLDFKPELTLKDYLVELKSIESEARSFYSDVDMESEQFVRMLLLDSLFLLPLFCGMPGSQGSMNQTNARIGSSGGNDGMSDRGDQMNEDMGNLNDNVNSQMIVREDEVERTADGMRWFMPS